MKIYSFLESFPIPFEKDDDFQIDFITAATVSCFFLRKEFLFVFL
jgi:hypothetical protein